MKTLSITGVSVAMLILPALTGAVTAPVGWETMALPIDPGSRDFYGEAVAAYEDMFIVGSPKDDDGATDAGSAYLYKAVAPGTWTVHKFTASDPNEKANFGDAVAIGPKGIFIGAPGDDEVQSGAGAVYHYQPDGLGRWTERKITATAGAPTGGFGTSLAVSGDNLLVGAVIAGPSTSRGGGAYLYQPDGNGGWHEHLFAEPNPRSIGTDFGEAVALDGENVLIGAQRNPGAAFLYKPDGADGWTSHIFTAPPRPNGEGFGFAVAISGDNVLIGAPFAYGSGHYGGRAYLYEPTGPGAWQRSMFTRSTQDDDTYGRFGLAVAIEGDTIAIGDPEDHTRGEAAGATYLYRRDGNDGWFEKKITGTGTGKYDLYGTSVALSGKNLVVGAPHYDLAGGGVYVTTGAAYHYDLLRLDMDGDCLPDRVERRAGNDPHDPDSFWTPVRTIDRQADIGACALLGTSP